MMNRVLVLFFCVALTGLAASAQSIQEGKAHYFAQRYQLANAVFQQLLKTNPADAEALYWGGQSAISLELDSTRKPAVARAWYDKAMQVLPPRLLFKWVLDKQTFLKIRSTRLVRNLNLL